MRENESGREKTKNWKRAAKERREKPGADSIGAEQIKTAEAEAAEKARKALEEQRRKEKQIILGKAGKNRRREAESATELLL